MAPDELVDLDRHPVTDRGRWPAAVGRARVELASTGVVLLEGFLRPDAIDALAAEARALAPLAHHSVARGTPYLAAPDLSFPEGHPRRREGATSLGAVAYDLFPRDSLLRSLYEWDPLMEFVAALLDRERLYRYADPFGALNLAVMADGDTLDWHFDQTDFVVSLPLQQSEAGGDFQSARMIRTPDDEHDDRVAAVLAGTAPEGTVHTEPMVPGTLMLFAGRWSLHRVTPVLGPTARVVGLLAYDTRPGTDSTAALKRMRYGRLPPPAGD